MKSLLPGNRYDHDQQRSEGRRMGAAVDPATPNSLCRWTGEFGPLEEAKKRLSIIEPLSLLLI